MDAYQYTDELAHYGILGQKWGVRNYQYRDGTLTPEGRIRYNRSIQGEKKAAKNVRRDLNRLDKRWAKSNYQYDLSNTLADRMNKRIKKKQSGIATEKQKAKLNEYDIRSKTAKARKKAIEKEQLAIIREAAKNDITVLGSETVRSGWEWYKTLGINMLNVPLGALQAVAGSPVIWLAYDGGPITDGTQFETYTSDQQANYQKQKQLYKNMGVKTNTSYGNKTKWR